MPTRQRSAAAAVPQLEAAAAELDSLRRLIVQRAIVAIVAAMFVGPLAGVNARLAFALAVGSVAEGLLSLTVRIRRRDLLLELASRPDAYALTEVRRFGMLLAAPRQRLAVARALAALLDEPGGSHSLFLIDRFAAVAPKLVTIEQALSDSTLVIEPVAMAALLQLLTDGEKSPLLNPAASSEQLDVMVATVLGGIHPGLPRADRAIR